MQIQLASRLNDVGEYYFSGKLREIGELNKTGIPVINLGIGSPDLPPHPSVIETLQRESARADVHAYQGYKGADALRNAFAGWYSKWYGVHLDPAGEILPLMGSKEGIMHVCMTYLDKGDRVLIPNPGYPTYRAAVQLAGGICEEYALKEENDWLIDFNELEHKDLSGIKMMWVNYPHMPTGRLPSPQFFKELVSFALRNRILVCHDNPYSFILNNRPLSILAVEGAKDVVIELNSLSKSHNMAGWRIGVMCGAARRINEILRFKSNMDSGMFLPVQLAAVQALSLGEDWYDELNAVYEARREKAFELLDLLQCRYSTEQSGLFLWARIPGNYPDAFHMSEELLHRARVFLTPGGIFGSEGSSFVRVSLCSPVEKLEEAAKRILNY